MNKRIKKKQQSIVNKAIRLENKQLMNGVLDKLRSHGLTPHKVGFPAGYFLFINKAAYEIMHFELKEFPDFYFGVWNKEICVDTKDGVKISIRIPLIFGERKCMVDKFKPSRTEWSPLYNANYFVKEQEEQLQDFWSIVETLPKLVHTPWELVDESKEEYEETLKFFELRSRQTQLILPEVYKRITAFLKKQHVDMGLLYSDDLFFGNNLCVIVDKSLGLKTSEVNDKITDYLAFEFEKDLEEVFRQFDVSEHVSIYQDEFIIFFEGCYVVDKEVLERSKTMSRAELNKIYNSLDIRTSNFVRLT